MRELSLFTGGGGGLLGTRLLGWRLVGCVEWEPACQELLRRRMDRGEIDACPIFGDVRKFTGEGYARRYRGVADVVTGGFPCQPFSSAGKRLGEDDPRNMWPATVEVLREVGPEWALLENVPALVSSPYFGRVLGDLASLGYGVRWSCLPASGVGAWHRRDRVWVVAHAEGL